LHRLDPERAGKVLILEKARHPRAKVCAGGLIPHALNCLAELGVALTVPHVTVRRAQVTTPRRTVRYEDGADLCTVIRRTEFDASLVAACRTRGIEVREDTAVTALERDADGVQVTTGDGQRYHTRLIVGADGSGSVVRRRLVDGGKEHIARAVMYDVPVAGSRWGGFREARYDFDFRAVPAGVPGYRWAFPCLIGGEPHANVGIYSVTPIGAALQRSLDEYLAALTTTRPKAQAFPIRWFAAGTRCAAPHVLLAGDAAGVDPLMGEGISFALEYGRFAADGALQALRSGDYSGAAYQRAIDASWLGKKLRRLQLATRLFYGRTWPLWFAVAERSRRARALGLRWYNGIDDWDRRSGWTALRALLTDASLRAERSR
jgi:flavin-dependent dehydrogenase